ncbi:MAG: flagellar motor protein MotB [Terriglobales bacterium]
MPTPPIIVIRKKGGHGGHHGGAWKVAYADFVTAMMALFIVLWLMNSSKPIQVAVSGYFKDPSGTGKQTGTTMDKTGEKMQPAKQDMAKIKEDLQKSIQDINDLAKLKNNIEMTVTSEGLRIELLESENGTFFDSGSSTLNKSGQEVAILLAAELGKAPNHLSIEGHTDAKPFAGKSSYSNWELSADRANAARRLMQQSGLRPDQVSQVRGFADQRLRNKKDPLDPSNRRISIIVQTLAKNAAGNETGEGKSSATEAQESGVAKPPTTGANAESEPTGEKDGK